jgi:RimJ/RimL family protein N-acetyltransferase
VGSDELIRRHTVDVTLADGGRIRLRPVVPDDKDRLVEGLRRLSPESRYRRFLSPVTELSARELAYLTELDYDDHFAWGALDLDDPEQAGLGVARYVRLRDDPTAAEAAVAVVDAHQGRGIGTLLLQVLTMTAREHGIDRLVASAVSDNPPLQHLLRELGVTTRWDPASGCVRAEVPIPPSDQELRRSTLFELLRAAARGEVIVAPVTGDR